MSKWRFRTLLIFGVICFHKTSAQTQSCTCVSYNTSCYQNIPTTPPISPTDGAGVIDIRIVNGNGGAPVTNPPATFPPPSTLACAEGTEPCCHPDSGCGIRYNIPPTPTTIPGPGQARYGSQPWQAVIMTFDGLTYLGSGVLLDGLNVLTAAHKLFIPGTNTTRPAATIKVMFGEWNDILKVETYEVQERMVSRYTIHPKFTLSNLFNDVAVIRLRTPLVIGSSRAINTACPPRPGSFDNYRCIVSGWGKEAFTGSLQNIVRETDVRIVPDNVCQNLLRKTRLGLSYVLNAESFICAGGEAGKDACVGDGGSPLMCNVGGKYQVVGLVSWGIGCGNASVPGVYVRVQSFLSWIQEQQRIMP